MSKTNPTAGIFAHTDEAAQFRRAPGSIGRRQPVGGRLKRTLDVALALLALVLLAPIILLVAGLLRVGLGRPILIAEDHIGFGGQVFTAYTFRTSLTQHARELPSDRTIQAFFDALRDSGLDHLPLLLSILRGDLSFVGPRPVTLDELDRGGQRAPDYFAARPGLVGLRQGRSDKFGYERRAAFDRYYVRRWSMWLDLALIANALRGHE